MYAKQKYVYLDHSWKSCMKINIFSTLWCIPYHGRDIKDWGKINHPWLCHVKNIPNVLPMSEIFRTLSMLYFHILYHVDMIRPNSSCSYIFEYKLVFVMKDVQNSGHFVNNPQISLKWNLTPTEHWTPISCIFLPKIYLYIPHVNNWLFRYYIDAYKFYSILIAPCT